MSGVIAVTGGTGRIGRRVVERVLASGAQVRLLARDPSRVPPAWAAAEVVTGDLDDPASVEALVAGAEVVLVLSPIAPWLDRYEETVVEASERMGVAHAVKLSTTHPGPDSPISWWRAHWRAEQRLRASPLTWTILRPNGIAQFICDFAEEVGSAGTLSTAAGDGRMALIHPDDLAAVTARLLLERGTHAGETLDLTGPESLSYDDIAATLSRLLGRVVVHRRLDRAAGLAHLAGAGITGWEAEGVLANWLMTRDGQGDFGRVTGEVERVLGRPPQPVEAFIADNLDLFRRAA